MRSIKRTGGYALLVCALTGSGIMMMPVNGHAARAQQERGVLIPDAGMSRVSYTTQITQSTQGAQLTARLDEAACWRTLNDALSRLGIETLQQDQADGLLVTDWILWAYDPKSNTGSSKPPRKGLSRQFQRHRFQFNVQAAATQGDCVILITDSARQNEVDITPDSEYSWLQWKDDATQPGAAYSFIKRLQGNFETAMTTRLQPVTVSSEPAVQLKAPDDSSADIAPVVVEKTPAADPDPKTETTPLTPQSVKIPIPVPAIAIPEVKPVPTPAVPVIEKQAPENAQADTDLPVETKAVTAEAADIPPPVPAAPETVATDEASPVVPESVAVPEPEHVVTEDVATQQEERVEQQITATSDSKAPEIAAVETPAADSPEPVMEPVAEQRQAVPEKPSRTESTAVREGLLVDASPAATWPALLQALAELGVSSDTQDPRQFMLITDWLESTYDKKNKQWRMRSKEDPQWAFSLLGKGMQQHRFQLIMVPVDNQAKSMIYAYHTGYKVQVDLTPDSSQTLLSWEDKETSPEIARAFLRRLRVVIAR